MKEEELVIEITSLKKDIDYIKKAIAENTEQHQQIIEIIEGYIKDLSDNKADKEEFKELKENYNEFRTTIMWKIVSLAFGLLSLFVGLIINKLFM